MAVLQMASSTMTTRTQDLTKSVIHYSDSYFLMCSAQGVLVCHPFPQGQTVNAQCCKTVLQYHLHQAVREKCSQLFPSVMFLHDDAQAHSVDAVNNIF
jgi:hypothetical protein